MTSEIKVELKIELSGLNYLCSHASLACKGFPEMIDTDNGQLSSIDFAGLPPARKNWIFWTLESSEKEGRVLFISPSFQSDDCFEAKWSCDDDNNVITSFFRTPLRPPSLTFPRRPLIEAWGPDLISEASKCVESASPPKKSGAFMRQVGDLHYAGHISRVRVVYKIQGPAKGFLLDCVIPLCTPMGKTSNLG